MLLPSTSEVEVLPQHWQMGRRRITEDARCTAYPSFSFDQAACIADPLGRKLRVQEIRCCHSLGLGDLMPGLNFQARMCAQRQHRTWTKAW